MFKREFRYSKGKLDYFDPDFDGKILIKQKRNSLKFSMHLVVYKELLYLRVLIVLMKKLVRFIRLFDYIFQRIFTEADLSYKIFFTIKYSQNCLKEFELQDRENIWLN
jgi:hypothetical protein